MKDLIKMMKKYWAHASTFAMVIAFAYWLWDINAMAGDAKKKADANELLQKQIAVIVIADNAKLEMFLEISGLELDDVREWSKIPREIPLDTLGAPIVGAKWLEISDDLMTGVLWSVSDSANILVDTLWHVETEE